MSFWDSKPVYPTGAVHTVTVKATYAERIAWKAAAQKYHKGTAAGSSPSPPPSPSQRSTS